MTKILHPNDFPTRDEFNALHQRDSTRAAHLLVHLRDAARKNLACFVAFRYFIAGKQIQWNWHLDYLCDIFTAVYKRQLKRTIVNIPPRFLKSELIGQGFPAWMIGQDDSFRSSVLSAGATAMLAVRDSRKTLEIIKSNWYKTLFPSVIVRKETEAEWETMNGASRNAAGAAGTIMGRGGDHLLWDDILQSQDAMSETVREKVNEWLGETFRNRLNDQANGTITGIMQRLHERDPTGYLLDQQKATGADQYTHIVLPNEAPSRTVVTFNGKIYATREAGDLLHPARIGPKETAALKAAMRANYPGQYNQNPVKMEGGHLDPRRILRLGGSGIELKSRLGLIPVFYMDFAATERQVNKDDPDFSCIEVWAKDQLGRLIILDCWRQQTADYAVIARTLIHMHRLWRPRFVKGERGALLNLFQPVLHQQMTLAGHFLTLEPLAGRGHRDKMERSMAYQGILNAGMVAAPEDAPWFAAFEGENRSFPNGAHDDTLDPAFDAAADYQIMPKGEAPVVSPTDPMVLLSDEVKRRIEEERERQLNPVDPNADDW
jgi:predicted phage terminase large subunit-like protein